ncbi:MAG TPA: hypothetical protein VLV50_05465 [Stellaceae bacterium]|nr:hypothetical protein [Stellaceae bacterium]
MTAEQRDRALFEAALLELPSAWMILADLRAGGAQSDYLVLHPKHGVALIDQAPAAGDPVPALRALLEREAFARFFRGDLPIVHVAIAADSARDLEQRLGEAFARERPLTIGDAEWPDAFAALVSTCDPRATSFESPAGEAALQESGECESASANNAAEPDFADSAAPFAEPSAAAGPQPEAWIEAAAIAREDVPKPRPRPAPRVPRWQLAAAFLVLGASASAVLSLPAEAPHRSPTVEVAVAPLEKKIPAVATATPPPERAVPPAPSFAAPVPEAPALPEVAEATPSLPQVSPSAPPVAKFAAMASPEMPPLPSVALAPPPAPRIASATPLRRISKLRAPAREVAMEAPRPPPSRPAPLPAPARQLQAAPFAAVPLRPLPQPVRRSCQTFGSRVSVVGRAMNVRGLACQASDGSWEIVSEAPTGR